MVTTFPYSSFSNLFSTSSKPPRRIPLSPSAGSVKYRAPTSGVQPLGDPNKKQRDRYNIGEKSRAYDFLQDDLSVLLIAPNRNIHQTSAPILVGWRRKRVVNERRSGGSSTSKSERTSRRTMVACKRTAGASPLSSPCHSRKRRAARPRCQSLCPSIADL